MRRIFRFMNKYFMVPLFRLGIGPFIGNPLSGYIMVLKTKGRKTGKVRYSPVTYAILNGKVYFVSAFSQASDWFRNLQLQPEIEIILSTGVISGITFEVTDEAQRVLLIRKIFQNAGFAGFMEGFNPFRISDEELKRRTAEMPLLCFQPSGVVSGVSDPGGRAWIWTLLSSLLHLLFLVLFLWLLMR